MEQESPIVPNDLPPGASKHLPRQARAPLQREALLDEITRAAEQLGFVGLGVAPVDDLSAAKQRWQAWLAQGNHGEMAYVADGQRATPRSLLAAARSAICVALPYAANRELVPLRLSREQAARAPAVGSVAGYAQGGDYHSVLWRKLLALADHVADFVGSPIVARPCVDTAPLLERALAASSGLGFVGKNGLLIRPGLGSYMLLGELLVDVDLPYGEPARDRCGECRACLDSCPTGAFRGPHDLDARRCIAYLTIELRSAIPRELRPLIGQRIFGCDACQSVCPFNSEPAIARAGSAPELTSQQQALDLLDLLDLGSGAYKRLVRETSMRRVSRAQLARNAAVALGNLADPVHVPALIQAVDTQPRALVREHLAWALGRLGGAEAEACLRRLAEADPEPSVRAEARQSLAEMLAAAAAAPGDTARKA